MRILIVGLGSIGRRHLGNILSRSDCEVAVCRRSSEDARATQREFGIDAFVDLSQSKAWQPDCVLIANPTSLHLEVAQWAIDHNCHVLIEKPIAHTREGLDLLLSRAEQQNLCVAIACNLRFHPALIAIRDAIVQGRIGRLLSVRAEVGTYLPSWHPQTDYRTEYSARADQGGGALLTLIHELDYVYWIAGDILQTMGWRTKISDLELSVDDIAEMVCRHKSGVISSIHMDFFDRAYNRRSRWVGERGTLDWIWNGPVQLLDANNREVLWEDPDFDLNQTYIDEIDNFMTCVKTGAPPRTTGREGYRVLEIAQRIRSL